MIHRLRSIAWIGLGVLVGALTLTARPAVHALPEYTSRTGQACTVCHVNPAGGGPRTPRGSLWIAQDRPDQVPPLPEEPASAAQPAATDTSQGQALYEELACAACHGPIGEGASGPPLNLELSADQIAQATRNGLGSMMAYPEDRLSNADLETLVLFVQSLAHAQPDSASVQQARPPAILACGDPATLPTPRSDCGGN